MNDILLQKFFEIERWEQALETGVDKHIDKGELRKLCSPEVRLALYNAIATDNYEIDHAFAPVYKDCDLSLLGKLPNMLVQNKQLYFVIDENNESEMSKYDGIIIRRMIGFGIKQIALHLTQENGKPSGFVGCVRYDYKEMDLDALELCVKELEIIHNNTP